jgi:hypothetical protein
MWAYVVQSATPKGTSHRPTKCDVDHIASGPCQRGPRGAEQLSNKIISPGYAAVPVSP